MYFISQIFCPCDTKLWFTSQIFWHCETKLWFTSQIFWHCETKLYFTSQNFRQWGKIVIYLTNFPTSTLWDKTVILPIKFSSLLKSLNFKRVSWCKVNPRCGSNFVQCIQYGTWKFIVKSNKITIINKISIK